MTTLLLSTADTDLLAARSSGYRVANPARVSPTELPALLDGVDIVVVRLLGGLRAWPEGVAALRRTGVPLVCLGGEATPDAELMAQSTVPAGVATQALAYLVEGGRDNLRELAAFLSDTILLTGEGFAPPASTPLYGTYGDRPRDPARPTVGIVFYRAHFLAGNTAFVDVLTDAVEAAGANAVAVFCGSLRAMAPDAAGSTNGVELRGLLGDCDTVITTVLAAGGAMPSDDDDTWNAGVLADLDVPVVQGLVLTDRKSVV